MSVLKSTNLEEMTTFVTKIEVGDYKEKHTNTPINMVGFVLFFFTSSHSRNLSLIQHLRLLPIHLREEQCVKRSSVSDRKRNRKAAK